MQDYIGKEVSEEKVAHDLGYSSVYELRRAKTDLGMKVLDLERRLMMAELDRDDFQRHVKRMMKVLNKLEEFFQHGESMDKTYVDKLILAIGVVIGKKIDWNNEVKEWTDA